MAIDVARYESLCQAMVHRLECKVQTTAARVGQISPVVTVDEGWVVQGCSLCHPSFGVVTRERWRVGRTEEMMARFDAPEFRRRARTAEVDVPRGTVERPGWKADAACRSGSERLDVWLRYLFLADTGARWQTDLAKMVCQECPVRGDCLVVAVWSEEPWGVWGGATATERVRLRSRWVKEGRVDSRLPARTLAS